MPPSTSSESSDDECDTGLAKNMNNVADLLWHNVKHRGLSAAHSSSKISDAGPQETSDQKNNTNTTTRFVPAPRHLLQRRRVIYL